MGLVLEADGEVINENIDRQSAAQPRIVLISQWPNVKNGEYELIEKIKQTGYKIAIVDFFGYDVHSDECLNRATLWRDFDFAISFHYDTPKFLNIRTFLWIANPLEFMHLRGDYRSVLLHHLRAYDDYLFNGSDMLREHIRNVVGSEFEETGLAMFPSCARQALISPRPAGDSPPSRGDKVFYCGVNWERGLDSSGRAQGLLDTLQARQIADFFGPEKLEGVKPWEGFSSYRGEIPFDGVSMSRTMQEYGAVLALSSPAHMRSRTSSSRVFEGIAAGVPVISDENPHVQAHFGDSIYYFRGDTEQERADSIADALRLIREQPEDARERVTRAQNLMRSKYCFESCFEKVLAEIGAKRDCALGPTAHVDVFLFHHDPDPTAPGSGPRFANIAHILEAAANATRTGGTKIRIVCCRSRDGDALEESERPVGVSWTEVQPSALTNHDWAGLRIGEKVALLADQVQGDFAVFLTQFDFPNYDYFSRALEWFAERPTERQRALHVGGFFVSDLASKAPPGTTGVVRNNASTALYRWTQNSLAEHQLGSMFFSKHALVLLESRRIDQFDAILALSIAISALDRGITLHRSRHMLLRVQYGYFHRHYNAYRAATAKGFWAQHYGMLSNYNHELNALYDIHHESPEGVAIADMVSGHSLPPRPPVDPAVHKVNEFIGRLRPAYHLAKRLRNAVRFKRNR